MNSHTATRSWKRIALVGAAAAVLALTACTSGMESSDTSTGAAAGPKDGPLTIAFLQKQGDQQYFIDEANGAKEAAKADGDISINVVDLGLVYGLHIDDGSNLVIDMTLTSAACPLTDVIEDQTDTALEGLVERFVINWVWMPPWGMEKITSDGREQLRALGFYV